MRARSVGTDVRHRVVVVVALVGASAAAAFPEPVPVPVKATTAMEASGVAGGGYLAWSKWSRSRPLERTVMVQRTGTPARRANRAKTTATPGSISGRSLAYLEYTRRGRSRIVLYDLRAHTRRTIPVKPRLNCPDCRISLVGASMAGAKLLYSWRSFGVSAVQLRDLNSGREVVLDRSTEFGNLRSGQAGEHDAVWARQDPEGWRVHRYDLTNETAGQLPNPYRLEQTSPAVVRDGTVYVVETLDRLECRLQRPRLVRYDQDGQREVLITFAGATSIHSTYAARRRGGTTVYFTRESCDGRRSDIYRTAG
jgi:hypothetical protein